MDADNELTQLVSRLKDRGLSVVMAGARRLKVTNPLSRNVVEHVRVAEGRYLTDDGYEFGRHGDETASAGRLAFLLGVPAWEGA